MSERTKRNMLDFNQRRKIANYLDTIESESATAIDIAETLTKTLGFTVSEGNVRGVAKDSGFKFARNQSARVLNSQTHKNNVIAQAIIEIDKAIGNKLRPDLVRDLARMSSKDYGLTGPGSLLDESV